MRDGNEERFSRLVGEIYDSTLAPSLWPDVLGKIAAFVGGQSAGLISRDSVSKSGNAHYTFGCNSTTCSSIRYAKLDPTTTLFFFAPGQRGAGKISDELRLHERHSR